jgi:hypothetical protein
MRWSAFAFMTMTSAGGGGGSGCLDGKEAWREAGC